MVHCCGVPNWLSRSLQRPVCTVASLKATSNNPFRHEQRHAKRNSALQYRLSTVTFLAAGTLSSEVWQPQAAKLLFRTVPGRVLSRRRDA